MTKSTGWHQRWPSVVWHWIQKNPCPTVRWSMVDGKKKKWVWGTEPCVTVGGGKPLDPVLPGETYKYLGTAFAGEKGNSRPLQIIGKGLHNITVAPLKPQQRMTVLRTYLIPQIYHIVVLDHVTGKQLENMDYKVRSAVRQWLKMPADTPVGFFHSEVKAGGLGIPRLKTSVPAQRAYRFRRLLKSNDPVVSFVMRTRLMLKTCHHRQSTLGRSPIAGSCKAAGQERASRGVIPQHRRQWIATLPKYARPSAWLAEGSGPIQTIRSSIH